MTACRLLTGEAIPFSQNAAGVSVSLPEGLPDEPDRIISLTLDKRVTPREQAKIYFTGKE